MIEEIEISPTELKELDFDDILKFAILQVLKSSHEDVMKYYISVENLESLMIDILDEDYFKKIEQIVAQVNEKYGLKKETETQRLREITILKFRELIKRIKKRIPVEVEGVL
jgi:hypothetical protein